MKRPAFLVDGQMEQRITQKLCQGAPVRLINLNGRDVSVDAIAKQVASHYRLLGNRYHPVIVLINRESRTSSANEIKRQLVMKLCEQGVSRDQLVIGVADRMIENWILADHTCHECIPNDKQFEGVDGKNVLKRLLSVNEVTYHETTIGVQLFCSLKPSIASSRSDSFREFLEELAAFCNWAAKET